MQLHLLEQVKEKEPSTKLSAINFLDETVARPNRHAIHEFLSPSL